jgi:hypothetical protein
MAKNELASIKTSTPSPLTARRVHSQLTTLNTAAAGAAASSTSNTSSINVCGSVTGMHNHNNSSGGGGGGQNNARPMMHMHIRDHSPYSSSLSSAGTSSVPSSLSPLANSPRLIHRQMPPPQFSPSHHHHQPPTQFK